MDQTLLLLFILTWSAGLQAQPTDKPTGPDDVRLVEGASHCAGRLEINHQGDWRPVDWASVWKLKTTAVVCRQLDCGSAVSTERRDGSTERPVWRFTFDCSGSESALRECRGPVMADYSSSSLEVICSESVRLVNGAGLCSGRVEVKSDQAWRSVCEADFDGQDAEVVCREVGCGAPSAHQGALYGRVEAPIWTKEFQCEGNESHLLDCVTSDSDRNICPPDKAVGLTCSEPNDVRLVEGASRCAGTLEINHRGDWRLVGLAFDWSLKTTAVVCRQLDCGSAVSVDWRDGSTDRDVWRSRSDCSGSESALRECRGPVKPDSHTSSLEVICSESVRLVNGAGLCSGRVEVKSDQAWRSVCEADFDGQDAEVVCREVGCGASSALQGALYGEVEAPIWTKEFQCEGSESRLLDCVTSDSDRNTCSPDKAVGLTCSEPDDVRLVEGASRCAGRLEINHQGDWRPVEDMFSAWNLKTTAVVCSQLDCGSAVSIDWRDGSTDPPTWRFTSDCSGSESALRECRGPVMSDYSFSSLEVICSESVRLVNGAGRCSGRVEVKSDQAWRSVCEADFDRQDAEVVCREVGCGAPSALQGALYGEVEAPIWTKEFQCEGNESRLLDCVTSDSDRNTCPPDKAVGLTCSEPNDVRLVEGASHCAGTLEINHQGDWRPVGLVSTWNLKTTAVVCRQLDCGSAVSTERGHSSTERLVWSIAPFCSGSESALRECRMPVEARSSSSSLEVICSESVRLVNGAGLCSGRVEVKSDQAWRSVCEADFDRQDAEVVCREVGCGAPSPLQGALYGEVEAPIWTKEFQCEGSESRLLDCVTSDSDRNTCSPDKAVGLTCSEPDDVRLVEGASRCAGRLEINHQGDWRPVGFVFTWNLRTTAVVCRQLDCGSAVSTEQRRGSTGRRIWSITPFCSGSESALRECRVPVMSDSRMPVEARSSFSSLEVICSDLLFQPNISLSASMYGVSEDQQKGLQVFRGFNFTISCSIQPQYPGGSFHLAFTSSNTTLNHTQPAVNHSAHFLFPAADHAHQGKYSCVYHIYLFKRNFSSESKLLSLSVTASPLPAIIIRHVVVLLVLLLSITALYLYYKAASGRKLRRKENIEVDYYNLPGSRAEAEPDEEAGAQGMVL